MGGSHQKKARLRFRLARQLCAGSVSGITGSCRAAQHPFPDGIVMAGWRVLLLPPSPMLRARPRWLCDDGRFRLDQERAWLVVDTLVAVDRVRRWLVSKQRSMRYLQRMRLVYGCSSSEAEQHCFEQSQGCCS